MVNEPNDQKWSYGAGQTEGVGGNAPGRPSPDDTVRLDSGRHGSGIDETIGLGVTPPVRPDRALPPQPADAAPPVGAPPVEHGYGHVDDGYDDGYEYDDEDDYRYDSQYEDYDDDDFDEEFDIGDGDARRNAIEWAVVLVSAVLLALFLRAFLVQAFWIPSPSMESTLMVRDRVLVNKLSYRLNDINRGDIVVFSRTDEELELNPSLTKDVIKRVIALEGETIELRDGQVFIDGQLLVEGYLDEGAENRAFGPTVVPDGHIFVMGDNRLVSDDSRGDLGPVDEDKVIGRAFFLFWPVDRVGGL